MTKILLDMNTPKFQKRLFSLEKVEQRSLLNTLNKIIILKLIYLVFAIKFILTLKVLCRVYRSLVLK